MSVLAIDSPLLSKMLRFENSLFQWQRSHTKESQRYKLLTSSLTIPAGALPRGRKDSSASRLGAPGGVIVVVEPRSLRSGPIVGSEQNSTPENVNADHQIVPSFLPAVSCGSRGISTIDTVLLHHSVMAANLWFVARKSLYVLKGTLNIL